MRLEGIHHITAITGDAPRNVEFYVGVMGLRMVKKTVNQDDPTIYHLFYADEQGDAGSDITFFEYPGAPKGRAGAGMVHRIAWRVASSASLDFWERHLADHDVTIQRSEDSLRFDDPEGLGFELRIDTSDDEPLLADHPKIPAEHALRGFDGARAYTLDPQRSDAQLTQTLGFTSRGEASYECRGASRGSLWDYDITTTRGLQGAGTVHHIAWASESDDHAQWHTRVTEAGLSPTPIIDRFWFRSIYFREPSGVLFEIATLGPGFDADEPLAHLGEKLTLPPDYEHLRDELADKLTPLPDPNEVRAGTART